MQSHPTEKWFSKVKGSGVSGGLGQWLGLRWGFGLGLGPGLG